MNTFSEYKIIDAHSHIFPEKIAQKASSAIGDFYGLSMYNEGNAQNVIQSGKKINVLKYLVCSTATVPSQVVSINDFIALECSNHPEFIGLGTVHPDFEDISGEILRIKERGLIGIKLHSDFQRFNIDDIKAYPIYETCQKLSLPILFHTGDNRYDFSSPSRLARVCGEFPNLKAIAAHFGGYRRWDEAAKVLKDCKNVYFDTCSSLEFISPQKAKELIYHFGVDRFFFGTDFPMWDHKEELERFFRIGLSKEENQLILSTNFEKFLFDIQKV